MEVKRRSKNYVCKHAFVIKIAVTFKPIMQFGCYLRLRIYKRKYLDTEGMVSHQINLKNVSDGMYSIQLKAGNESHSERLILKND